MEGLEPILSKSNLWDWKGWGFNVYKDKTKNMKPIEELKPKKGKYYAFRNKDAVPIILECSIVKKEYVFCNNTGGWNKADISKDFTHFEEWAPIKESNLEKLKEMGFKTLEQRVEELENEVEYSKGVCKSLDVQLKAFKELVKVNTYTYKQLRKYQSDKGYNAVDFQSCGSEERLSEWMDKPEEELTVEDILEIHKWSSREEKTCESLPKQVIALWKLKLMADYVNGGKKYIPEDSAMYNRHAYPVCSHDGNLVWLTNDDYFASPIYINTDKIELFKSIGGIDKLIKDYLS